MWIIFTGAMILRTLVGFLPGGLSYIFYLFWLVCLATVAVSAIKREWTGVNLLGCIGAWIYIGAAVMAVLFNYWISYQISEHGWYWYDDHRIINCVLGGFVDFVLYAGLTLFVLGSRAWLAFKIATPIALWILCILGITLDMVLGYIGIGYSPYNCLYYTFLWTIPLVLAIVWRVRE